MVNPPCTPWRFKSVQWASACGDKRLRHNALRRGERVASIDHELELLQLLCLQYFVIPRANKPTFPPSLESHLCNYLSLLMLKSARERLSFLSLAAAAAASRVMMMSGRNDVTRSVTNSGILGVRAPLPPSYPFMFPSRSEKDL